MTAAAPAAVSADTLVTRLDGWTLSVQHLPATDPDAATVVYVHGLGGSSSNWSTLMGELAGEFDQWAPDLPGFGASPPPDDGDYSPDGHARALAAWLDDPAGPRTPVHLVGNSLGGAIAVTLTAARPDLVASLTLISPALPDLRPGPFRAQVAAVALPGIGPRLAAAVRGMDPDRRVAAMLPVLYGDPTAVTPEQRATAAEEFRRRQSLPYADDALVRSTRGIVRAYLDRGPDRLWARAARIDAATLLLYSRHDKLVDPRHAQRAYGIFRNASVRTLHSTGHVAQMEAPRMVARILRRFVADNPPAPAQ